MGKRYRQRTRRPSWEQGQESQPVAELEGWHCRCGSGRHCKLRRCLPEKNHALRSRKEKSRRSSCRKMEACRKNNYGRGVERHLYREIPEKMRPAGEFIHIILVPVSNKTAQAQGSALETRSGKPVPAPLSAYVFVDIPNEPGEPQPNSRAPKQQRM